MEVMQLDATGNWQGFEILLRDSREASLHRERGGLTTTRVDVSLWICSQENSTRGVAREINGRRAQSSQHVPPFSLWVVGI